MKHLFTLPGLRMLKDSRMIVPSGDSSERHSSPENGELRANTQTGLGEIYILGRWVQLGQSIMPLLSEVSANTVHLGNGIIPVNTTSGTVTITLSPLSIPGDRVIVFDPNGSWYDYPLTLTSSHPIEGDSSDVALMTKRGAVELLFVDAATGWVSLTGPLAGKAATIDSTEVVTTSQNVSALTRYMIGNISANITLTLPSSANDGDVIEFIDINGKAETRTVTISGPAGRVDGNQNSFIIANGYQAVSFRAFNISGNTYWYRVADSGTGERKTTGVITTTTTISDKDDFVQCDTSSSTITVRANPNPKEGSAVWINDISGNASQRNITFDGNGNQVDGGTTAVINDDYGFASFLFTGGEWRAITSSSRMLSAGSNRVEAITGNKTAISGYRYATKTSGAAITFTLPSTQPLGSKIFIHDVDGNANANVITVTGSQVFDGPFKINRDYGMAEFTYVNLSGIGNRWVCSSEVNAFVSEMEYTGVATTNIDAKPTGDVILMNVSGGTRTVDLPLTPTEGAVIHIRDTGFTVTDTKFIIVNPGTKKIDGSSTDVTLRQTGVHLSLIWINGEWRTLVNSEREMLGPIFAGRRSVTSSVSAKQGEVLDVTTTGSAKTITLLSSGIKPGAEIVIRDETGNAGINPITIIGGSGLTPMLIQRNFGTLVFKYLPSSSGHHWVAIGEVNATRPRVVTSPITANKTLGEGDSYAAVNPSGNITVTLPSGPQDGDKVFIYDSGNAISRTSNVTINRNGNTINGATSNLVLAHPGDFLQLVYMTGNGWRTVQTSLNIAEATMPNRDIVVTTNATVYEGTMVFARSGGGAFTITLFNGTRYGSEIMIIDDGDSSFSNEITLAGSILGGNAKLSSDGAAAILRWSNTPSGDRWVGIGGAVMGASDGSMSGGSGSSGSVLQPPSSASSNTTLTRGSHYIDVDASSSNVTLTLAADSDIGDVLYFYDTGKTFDPYSLIINPGAQKINGSTTDVNYNVEGGWIHLVKVGSNDWDIVAQKPVASKEMVWERVTATVDAVANHGYFVDVPNSSSDIKIKLPGDPEPGDRVGVSVYGANPAMRVIVMEVSLATINENVSDGRLVAPGTSAVYHYIDSSYGWAIESHSMSHEGIIDAVHMGGGNYLFDFKNDAKTIEHVLNRDCNVDLVYFKDYVTTAFIMVLKQGATGYNITLPAGWKANSGSEPLSTVPNATNVIQGLHISGTVYFSVSVYL